jgi:hypothetical protein
MSIISTSGVGRAWTGARVSASGGGALASC